MGDAEAFMAFVQERQAALLQLAWALTGERQLGEDLAQATLDRLWARWPRVSAGGDPWPYTQRIVVSLASTWWRRRWHGEIATTDPPEAAEDVEAARADMRQTVAKWLAVLPSRQRAVVVLRFLMDLPVDETAAVLRCSSGTVKSQTAKALGRLRTVADQEVLS